MADTIKYEEIKDRTVEGMLKTGNLTSNAENNLANNQGKLWGNLLGALEGNLDWAMLEGMNNQKEIRKVIQEHLKKEILKTGEELEKNEKGGVIWSKDKKTKPIMKYTSDIAKIVSSGMAGELLPGDGTFAARCDILKACKQEKSALDLIKLAISQIDSAMGKADSAEYPNILKEFQTLSAHVATVQP